MEYKIKLQHVGKSEETAETSVQKSLSTFQNKFAVDLTRIRVIPQLNFKLEKTFEFEFDVKSPTADCGTLIDPDLRRYIHQNAPNPTVPWLEILDLENFYSGFDKQSHDVSCSNFTFGSFTGRNTFLARQTPICAQVGLTFEHHTTPGSVKVFFSLPGGPSNFYQIEISYSTIDRILVAHDSYYFFLACPGKIYRSQIDNNNRIQKYETLPKYYRSIFDKISPKTQWTRTFIPPNIYYVIFGNSSVIRFGFAFPDPVMNQVLSRIQQVSNIPIYWTAVRVTQSEQLPSDIPTMPNSENVDVLYAWNSFTSRGFRVTDSLTDNFVNYVQKWVKKNPKIAIKTLEDVTNLVDSGLFFSFLAAFEHLATFYQRNLRLLIREEYDNYKYVRRAERTVYRQLFFPPEPMHDNRVLRKYSPDSAIRVCFRDDDLKNRLSPGFKTWDPEIFDNAIVTFLTKGMFMLLRHYEFLGWSNSQLRDHCVWMYAQDQNGIRAEDIRQLAGDFSMIKSVPKYCARFGQCFTQTEESVTFAKEIENQVVIFEPDIEHNGYCFSDGIGRISESLLKEIFLEMKVSVTPRMPSAIQIRYSGCKGMLALDPTLTGRNIIFRPSQNKFKSTSTTLEVAKYSKPGKVYLNRQFIAILEFLRSNIPHGLDIFHKLQEKQLMEMSEMLLYEEEAVFQLQKKCSLGLGYTKLHEDGILFTTEPFFRGLLLAIHRKVNSNLANKARLEIPSEHGRTMFGVIDETRTLDYGEVFIQYSEDINEPGKNTQIVRGPVVVTKNPCTQPGDVRIFKAKNVPALHHIVDVIVFPQLGRRPHPDEMAGSDLDGDEYSCIWSAEFFFPENYPPMHFPKLPDKIQKEPIEVKDMINWLNEFIQNDRVGLIANAHLAHSDIKGLASPICKELARKHSIAVDFPKTGHPASLERNEKVLSYPDYMSKHFNTHHSNKILGQLYRKAHRVEQLSLSSIRSKPEVSIDQDLLHPEWMKYMEVACEQRDVYFQQLMELMSQYGIESESEILSGNILRIRCVMMGRNEAYDIEKILGIRVARLQERTRALFFEEFGGEELANGKNSNEVLIKASAYYAVTYCPDVAQPNKTELLSFPWFCISDLLGKLKQQKQNSAPLLRAPLSEKLQRLIAANRIKISGLPPFMSKYCSRYTNLSAMVHWLLTWGRRRKIFKNELGELNFVGFILLFSIENGFICRPSELKQEKQTETINVGDICLKIIQHWSSQTFRKNGVSLKRFERFFKNGELRLDFNTGKIMKLHQAAFDTFHSVAISGNLSALQLEDPSETDTVSQEFKGFQIQVSVQEHNLCLSHWGNDETAVKIAVRNASGMQNVEIGFQDVGNQRKKWIISGRGSFQAHRNLKQLLIAKDSMLIPYLTQALNELEFDEY